MCLNRQILSIFCYIMCLHFGRIATLALPIRRRGLLTAQCANSAALYGAEAENPTTTEIASTAIATSHLTKDSHTRPAAAP